MICWKIVLGRPFTKTRWDQSLEEDELMPRCSSLISEVIHSELRGRFVSYWVTKLVSELVLWVQFWFQFCFWTQTFNRQVSTRKWKSCTTSTNGIGFDILKNCPKNRGRAPGIGDAFSCYDKSSTFPLLYSVSPTFTKRWSRGDINLLMEVGQWWSREVREVSSRGHGLDGQWMTGSIYRTDTKLPSEVCVRLSTIRMPLIAMASTIWTSPGAARFGLEVPTKFKFKFDTSWYSSQRFVYILIITDLSDCPKREAARI